MNIDLDKKAREQARVHERHSVYIAVPKRQPFRQVGEAESLNV
jgi:hypothetical protein